MTQDFDLTLEAVQQDNSWWLPGHITTINRPEIYYTIDPSGPSRLNCVNRVRSTLSDYDELVREVVAAHRPNGRSQFTLSAPSLSAGISQSLQRHGYTQEDMADAWTINVTAPRMAQPNHIRVQRVETIQGLRDMYTVMRASFPRIDPAKGAALNQELAQCSGPLARCRRYIAYDRQSAQPISTGAINVFADHGIGFMWGGSTVPEARGGGVYSSIVTARMRDAHQAGLQRLGLYALRKTSGPIIERQGFTKHGPVAFWAQHWETR